MTIYLANNYLKDTLIDYLLKDNNLLFDIDVKSPKSFINEAIGYIKPDILTLYNIFNNLELDELKICIKDEAFINQVIEDRILIDYFNIDINNIHPEYKLLLNQIPPYPKDKLNVFLNNDFSNYIIIKGNYDFITSDILDKMVLKNARYLDFNNIRHQDYKLEVLNIPTAINSIAYIIYQNNYDINKCAIVTDNSYNDLINIHLNKYNLKANFLNTNTSNTKAIIVKRIIDLYKDFSPLNYIKLITLNLYPSNYSTYLIEYLSKHIDYISLKEFDRFKDNTDYYKDIEDKANKCHLLYLDLLNKIKEVSSYKELLILAFNTINDNSKNVKDIKKTIEKYVDNINLLKNNLLNLKVKDDSNGLKVIGFNQEIFNIEHLFVLNPNIKIYPGFKTLAGFLNEDILLNSNFPSILKRYEKNNQRFNYLNYSTDTIYILIESTLDGKKEEYDHKFKDMPAINNPYNEINNDNLVNYKHYLNHNVAKDLFTKDDILYGSISAFETYLRCPYSYYLKYGLKLHEPQTKEISAATTGTIFHLVMEELIKEKGQDYIDDYLLTLDNILKKEKDEILYLYPNDKALIESVFERIKKSLTLELDFLKMMEEETSYKPTDVEYKIEQMITDKVFIKGFIDRIDRYNTNFRIMDYKTSVHNITESSIKYGDTLQLITYAILYHQITDLIASGIYYINASHKPIKMDEYRFDRNGFKENDINDDIILDNFITNHKLKGLTFINDDDLDFNGRFITGKTKNGYGKKYLIDFNKTKDLLTEIYDYLYDSITNGNFNLSPKENACDYCRYHRICHFNGVQGLNKKLISSINIGQDKDETK